jgi:transcriptional regulator with XRE-family HTH domain
VTRIISIRNIYARRMQSARSFSPCRRVAIRPKLNSTRISQKPKGYPEDPVTLAEHLLKRRKQLGLLQREVAAQLGIRHESYLGWEKHGQEPEVWRWQKVVNFLGYDPHPAPTTLPQRLAAYRRCTGLTQRAVGKLLGVNECTVQSWERGRHPPRRESARLLGNLIDGAGRRHTL